MAPFLAPGPWFEKIGKGLLSDAVYWIAKALWFQTKRFLKFSFWKMWPRHAMDWNHLNKYWRGPYKIQTCKVWSKSNQFFNPKSAKKKKTSENVVCWSCLLQIIAWHYRRIKYRNKQRGPRTDCSYRNSLIWVHTVCHRGFLNISADEKSRRLLLRLAR